MTSQQEKAKALLEFLGCQEVMAAMGGGHYTEFKPPASIRDLCEVFNESVCVWELPDPFTSPECAPALVFKLLASSDLSWQKFWHINQRQMENEKRNAHSEDYFLRGLMMEPSEIAEAVYQTIGGVG